MSQHDYIIDDANGAVFRADLNDALAAIVTNNAGATEPTTTYAYQWWADTTTGLLKQRNAANDAWLTIRSLAGTAIAGSFTTLGATGNVTLGDATTDTVTVSGYMGVGGAGASTAGLLISSNALTSANQKSVYSTAVASSACTGSFNSFAAAPSTAAASFTCGIVAGFVSLDAVKGAGSTITNQHGVYIADQTQGTNNYGITSQVSSGTNKWNIYASGTAFNYMAGGLGIGSGQTGNSSYGVTGGLLVNGSPIVAIMSATGTPTTLVALNGGNQAADRGVAFDMYSPGTGLGGSGTRITSRFISASSSAGSQGGYLRFDTENASGTLTERLRIDSSGNVGIGKSSPTVALDVTGAIAATTTLKSGGYTVATLPAGSAGMRAYVTDATAPTWLAALTGGGAVVAPVFHNGTAWLSA